MTMLDQPFEFVLSLLVQCCSHQGAERRLDARFAAGDRPARAPGTLDRPAVANIQRFRTGSAMTVPVRQRYFCSSTNGGEGAGRTATRARYLQAHSTSSCGAPNAPRSVKPWRRETHRSLSPPVVTLEDILHLKGTAEARKNVLLAFLENTDLMRVQ